MFSTSIVRRSIPAWAGKPSPYRDDCTHPRVYPRVGGETARYARVVECVGGLSPRGRGNHEVIESSWADPGSIPAWAGKPTTRDRSATRREVYPRVGGETVSGQDIEVPVAGLSPRGRGNRMRRPSDGHGRGSIPAWAGKPPARGAAASLQAVYPRVGGETLCELLLLPEAEGLSPRGRGNRHRVVGACFPLRSIPAWAGKPVRTRAARLGARVYPRVGGETYYRLGVTHYPVGLSPRGRGNLSSPRNLSDTQRSIPAWAGKPLDAGNPKGGERVYPRVGGETTKSDHRASSACGLSPRGRGNRRECSRGAGCDGSIPAWAGKPRTPPTSGQSQRVYPRVGGETSESL